MTSMLQMFSVLAGMESVHRFSMTRLAVPESVLSHTGMVTLLCMFIGDELNSIENGLHLNMDLLLRRALLHDMEEIFSGDIARPTKYESLRSIELFDGIKIRAFDKVLRQLCCSEKELYKELHEDAKSLDDASGIVVTLADLLAVTYKVWDEVLVRNNLSLMRVINIDHWGLHALQAAVKQNFVESRQSYFLLCIISDISRITKMAIAKCSAAQIGELK
jgi:5'-deoxynucleotidase YfbR-like HD superfamily hydrolase